MTTSLSRRSALSLGAAALAMPRVAQAARAPVLVELFSSQGCSSCPSADSLMGQLKLREDLIVVSLNVDYWDYLGWRDTLAKPEFSQRQFDYAKTRGDMQAYTPQVVVNGRVHAVGSRLSDVETAIDQVRATPASTPLLLKASQTDFSVEIPASDFSGSATLWLMAIAAEKTQLIERGENTGLTVTYHNVVRNMVPAAMWDGKAFSQKWTKDAVLTADCTSCVAVLQQHKTGPVLGLARWHRTVS
jgi:hypothetical protein